MAVFLFFFYLVCEAIIGTAPTPGLLCQPRVIVKMITEKQMDCRLAEETEVHGGNLPQRHFCPSQNPTWPDPGLNPGRRGGKPATNRLSYGAAFMAVFLALQVYIKYFFLQYAFLSIILTLIIFTSTLITQGVPRGKVNIVGGRSIGHFKQKKKCMCTCVLFWTVSEIDLFHCIDEQHTMSSHELQSALMLTMTCSNICTNFVTWTVNTGIRNSM
jgi:hypothetical protein